MIDTRRVTPRLPGHQRVRAVVWIFGAVLLLGHAAGADRPDRDPVERFRQALIMETDKTYLGQLKGDSLKKAVAFRESNLKAAEKNLTNLSDLSRALLLVEWPAFESSDVESDKVGFDAQSDRIVRSLRKRMATRFNKGIGDILTGAQSSAAAKIAVANLLAETVVKATDQTEDKAPGSKAELNPQKGRLVLDLDFKGFANQLAGLSVDPNDRVRVAVAGALGQAIGESGIAGKALRRQLTGKFPETTRAAASSALLNLSTTLTNRVSLRGSEPDVTPAEPRRFRRTFDLKETVDIANALTGAATAGLDDPAPAVRRQCIAAIRNVTGEVMASARSYQPQDKTLPPAERIDLSPEEIENLQRAREAHEEFLRPLASWVWVKESRDYLAPLNRCIKDADPAVRLEAYRTLAELARTRQAVRELREKVPGEATPPEKAPGGAKPPVKPKKDDKDDLSRRKGATGDILLTAGEKATPLVVLPKPQKGAPPDGIADLLSEIGTALATEGVRDPDARVRRAALEAVEALGGEAIRYAPQLVRALEDRDVFVRWISARTLRKIAEEDDRAPGKSAEGDRPGRPHKHTDQIIPALAKGLADEDLDGRIAMARALIAYGPSAKAAVPALTKRLFRDDAEFRVLVIQALAAIGEESRSALPAVVANFKDQDPRIRAEAARLVGQLAKYSAQYLEALEDLTGDPDPKVRDSAGAAILRIQPK